MQCQSVKNKLKDYQEGKLSLSEYKIINEHLSKCDSCANKLDAIVNKNLKNEVKPSQTSNIKKKNKKWLFVTLFLLLIVASVFSEGFGGKIGLFWSNDQDPFGEAVNISTENNNIKLDITHIAASDAQTILYFEIRDLNSQNQFFIDYDGMKVKGNNLWKKERSFNSAMMTDCETNAVCKGRLHLPPIKEEEATVTVSVPKLFHLNSENIKLYSEEWTSEANRSYVQGDWQVEVPIKKYEAKTVRLNETIDINGVNVEVDHLFFDPTETVLIIKYKRDKSNDYNQEIFVSHLNADGKQYEVIRKQWAHSNDDEVVEQHVYLKSMYFNQPKKVEVHFGKMTQHIANQVKIGFDPNDIPYTFEYLGEPITIKKVEVGNPTQVVVEHQFDEERAYNELIIDFQHYRFSEGVIYDLNPSTDAIWLDKAGNKYTEVSQFDDLNELRYFSKEQRVEIYPLEGEKPFEPNFLFIQGYTKETILDEVLKISLDRKD